MGKRDNDIKAPDGFLLGGLRRVRPDGTILFQRGWWELPAEVRSGFIGHNVWVHIRDANGVGERLKGDVLEVAYPGLHIYKAAMMKPPHTVIAMRNKRQDAKPVYRNSVYKAWAARCSVVQTAATDATQPEGATDA